MCKSLPKNLLNLWSQNGQHKELIQQQTGVFLVFLKLCNYKILKSGVLSNLSLKMYIWEKYGKQKKHLFIIVS